MLLRHTSGICKYAVYKEEIAQLWAEAVQIERAGEALYLDTDELKQLAEAEQSAHFEESPMTGDILKYLDTLLPENWAQMDLSARRSFIHGDDFGNSPIGTVKRDRVCPLEVWCEMFNGDRKDFNTLKSKEIQEVIEKTDEWLKCKYPMKFGEMYGSQRGFKRILKEI